MARDAADARPRSGDRPRIGVFGGTFDPPHSGHLIVAQDAWSQLGLERVLFVPARVPPHKERTPAPAGTRLEMVRAAIAGDGRFQVDDLELGRPGASYTVDTMRELSERYADAELVLLMGADQFVEFESWKEPDAIRRLARIGLIDRSGASGDGAALDDVLLVEATRIDISSTLVRERVGAGLPIRYLVPPAVEAIIRRESLYDAGTSRIARRDSKQKR